MAIIDEAINMITPELSSLLFRAFELIEEGTKSYPFKDDEWKEYSKTEIKHIVCGLAAKSNQHSKAAVLLLQNNLLPEAVILIRCAYEATVLARYLMLYPENKNNYLANYDVVDYRKNMQIKAFTYDECNEADKLELESSRREQKKYIHNQLSINNDTNDNYKNKLESTNFNKLPSFEKFEVQIEKIREKNKFLDKPDGFLEDEQIKFQAYRDPSCLVHQNWVAILQHYLLPDESEHIQTPTNVIAILIGLVVQNTNNLIFHRLLGKEACQELDDIVQKSKNLNKIVANLN